MLLRRREQRSGRKFKDNFNKKQGAAVLHLDVVSIHSSRKERIIYMIFPRVVRIKTTTILKLLIIGLGL